METECRPGDRVSVEIESMAYGPHSIARHGGLVLFVRGAVPGERVEVEIRERRRRHAFADVRRVERPASQRTQPPCPIVEQCGGCPWQHLSYGGQLEAKHKIVTDQLTRIAGLSVDVPPLWPSPRVYGYRRRLKLRVDRRRLGFYAGGTHDLVQVAHCALAESEIDAGLAAAQSLASQLKSNLRRLEIVARHPPGAGVVLVGEIEGGWVESDAEVCRRWLDEFEECLGMTLRGKRWQHSWGEMEVRLEPRPELALAIDGSGFTQVNPAANRMLVELVLRMLGDVSGASILDAYAGAGNFSAPLAQLGATVTAVEQSRDSCRGAEANAAGYDGRWRVEQGRVDRVLARLARRGDSFDAVLLDPPRSGASETISGLLSLRPPVIVYVSCDPATLARDLGELKSAYRVEEVQPIDMFPHTYHVETVARCALR